MEYLILILLGLSILTNVFLIVIFYFTYNQKKYINAINKDNVDALSIMMSTLVNEFKNNQKIHESMQEWNETTIEKLSKLENENAQKLYDAFQQQQYFLNRLGEFMGYRPRGGFE